jgi:hypothetical protein
MARIIPNQNTYIAFATTVTNIAAPTALEVSGGVNLTGLTMSLNASSQGNTVPTPSFDTLFETSISGTTQASFSGDFYRDNSTGVSGDLAWKTLPRKTSGFFIISRFGGKGANQLPIAADTVEVWPVVVTSRTMANMSNNTVMSFTVTCSVPQEPNEAAVVAS